MRPPERIRVSDARASRPGAAADLSAAIRRLVAFRGLLLEVVRRDLLVRYKQTLMGVAWAVVVPLAAMLVFAMVFTRAVPIETDVPYPLFAYSGLLAWNLLAGSLRAATTSLTLNHALVTKVPFPRGILPLSAVAANLLLWLLQSGPWVGEALNPAVRIRSALWVVFLLALGTVAVRKLVARPNR